MQSSWQDPPEHRGAGGGGGQMQYAMPPLTRAVKLILIANAAVFLVSLLFYVPAGTREMAFAFQRVFGISPGQWIAWFPFLPVWQIFTWGFLHSIDQPTHILFNMLFLYFLGTMLEGIIGSRRFLVTYVSALLVSGAATLLVGLFFGQSEALVNAGLPLEGQYPTTLGASGAVFAVVVAMAVLRPTTRVIFIIFPITLRTLAIIYVGLNAYSMVLQFTGANSNVAYLAHLTGAAWGYALVKRGWIWRDPFESLEAWRVRNREKNAVADEELLDQLLKKINREGIHSLSAREKAFLKRASKGR